MFHTNKYGSSPVWNDIHGCARGNVPHGNVTVLQCLLYNQRRTRVVYTLTLHNYDRAIHLSDKMQDNVRYTHIKNMKINY